MAKAAYHNAMTAGNEQKANKQTRIAVLGTLAEFHKAPLPYDLESLVALVAEINPDLLCLDISLVQWQRQDFSALPPEYGQALLPLAAQTDIVVVPIGGEQQMPRATAGGWRGVVIGWARKALSWLQAGATGPDAINQGWRHDAGNALYALTRRLAGAAVAHAYHTHIEQVSRAALQAAANNPGSRILVVTNIQYCHHIRPRLQQQPGVVETAYTDL
jgi:hypothetical protein